MQFMKDKMKKKDEANLEEMKHEIDEAEAAEGSEDSFEKFLHGDEPQEEAPKEEKEDAAESNEELKKLQEENEKLAASVKEKDDKYLRLQAEFQKFRRRTGEEKDNLSDVVTQSILKDMLPLLDNFERALASDKDTEGFHKGVEMIYKQMGEALKKHGLEYIDTKGKKFDPNFHQAVMRVQNPELEDDMIAAELQKGYMARGRVIRPSMVQVVAN